MTRKAQSKTNPLPILETHIQEAAAHVLQLDGWRRLRCETVSRREWGKGFGEAGMADDLFIRYWAGYRPGAVKDIEGKPDLLVEAQVMWIEWKREEKFQYRQNQHDWHLHERKLGALTVRAGIEFVATFDGFMEWYLNSGLARRQFSKAPVQKPVEKLLQNSEKR